MPMLNDEAASKAEEYLDNAFGAPPATLDTLEKLENHLADQGIESTRVSQVQEGKHYNGIQLKTREVIVVWAIEGELVCMFPKLRSGLAKMAKSIINEWGLRDV